MLSYKTLDCIILQYIMSYNPWPDPFVAWSLQSCRSCPHTTQDLRDVPGASQGGAGDSRLHVATHSYSIHRNKKPTLLAIFSAPWAVNPKPCPWLQARSLFSGVMTTSLHVCNLDLRRLHKRTSYSILWHNLLWDYIIYSRSQKVGTSFSSCR